MKNLITSTLLAVLLAFGFAMAQDSVADALRLDDDLSTTRTIMELEEEVGDLLEGEGVFTLFAPNNDAFTNLSGSALETLFDGGDVSVGFIENHLLAGPFTLEILFALLEERGGQMTLLTVGGNGMSFTLNDEGAIIINGIAGITEVGDITGTGVLHSITTVLPYDVDDPEDDDDTEL